MKIIYITREGENFIGGADNLSGYLKIAFCKKLELIPERVVISSPIESASEINNLSNYDLILAESSALPYTEELLKVSDKVLKKMHVFMHSVFLAQENEMSEGVIGPSAWDFKDASGIIELVQRGLHPYYGAMNHVWVLNSLIRSFPANYLDLSEFRSRNMNNTGELDFPTRKENAILFATGYYHPGVGTHLLMKMLETPGSENFEWYIVGRIFDHHYRLSDKALWSDVYAPLLRKPNVHLIEFAEDITQYYKLCKFNLVLSKGDSYSFKALEALSYGCINVATEWNKLLPWSEYSLIVQEERDLDKYARKFIDKLIDHVPPLRLPSHRFSEVLKRFENFSKRRVHHYLTSLLMDLLVNCREFLKDSGLEENYWKYNRLT